MALLKVSNHICNDPKSIKAIFNTFDSVEALGEDASKMYMVYRVQGQGAPREDKTISVTFSTTIDGKHTRIDEWQMALVPAVLAE